MVDEPEDLTTGEAAEALGVPLATLKVYLDKVPNIPMRTDARNRRRLDAKAMALLRTVKALRDKDVSYESIRRRLEPELAGEVDVAMESPATYTTSPQAADLDAIREVVAESVHTAIKAQTEMAEKYAIAARQVGQLEARLELSQKQLAEALDTQERLHQAEKERLSRDLADKEAEVERLRQALMDAEVAKTAQAEAEQARPWWRRVLGN